MRVELFSPSWVAAWGRELNASEAYRRAAANWRGAIALRARGETDPESGREKAAYLDLAGGACRDARVATEEDLAAAPWVLSASGETWERLLAGRLDTLWALMSGKLKLERGRLGDLTPHAAAAQELLAAARRVDAGGPFAVPPPVEVSAVPPPPPLPLVSAVPAAPPLPPPLPPPAPRLREAAPSASGGRFRSTSPRGLDRRLFPSRLWEKAKRYGIWNPADVDFRRDRADWAGLRDLERDVLLRLSSLFQAGEEAVTVDLLPLVGCVAAEGRLEEEIYLTSFLWEEAKHVDAFRRFFDEVAGGGGDLARYHTPAWRRIFECELPEALGRLGRDPSPAAQARASVTYNLIVEGVLAETGYHACHAVLERHGILPGMLQVVGWLKRDEARHLAYGVFLLSRLVAEHGETAWRAIEERMGELLEPALAIVEEVFRAYEVMPFGLRREEFADFAAEQFRRRLERVRKARGQDLDEVLYGPGAEEAAD